MCLPWFSFYGLAGDSMHNMNLSLILIPAQPHWSGQLFHLNFHYYALPVKARSCIGLFP